MMTVLPFQASASAEQTGSVHPTLGLKTPNDLQGRDVLLLPERERLAWVHGAISLSAQTAAAFDPVTARCIMDWYFEDEENYELIIELMEGYPENRASAVIFGVIAIACDGLKSQAHPE